MSSLRVFNLTPFRAVALITGVIASSSLFASNQEERADKLLYKEALYHIYNNDYFKALNLLENSHTGATHVDNEFHNRNHLLAVQASLHLGMYKQAEEILEHLKFTNRESSIKDLSWLYWGKLRYQQGQWQQAIQELQNVSPKMSAEHRDEANYYLAMSYLHLGQPERATPVLAKMGEKSLWTAYAYYNLAMRYSDTDSDPSRALVALRVAGAMTNLSPEGLAINDRIHLTGGYLALREQDYGKAVNFLQKVRVKGETAPSAIYAYGMAYSGMGQHRSAVQMWHRAKKYSLVIPGVAESFQSIAYGFEQENLRSSAIESYLEAITVYEKELVQLGQLIQDVKKRGALKVLLEEQPRQDVEWFLLTDVVTNTPKVGFVSYVMSDESFYNRSKTLLELRELQKTSQAGDERLKVFENTLIQKQRTFGRRAENAMSQAKVQAFNQVISDRNRLAKDLEVAERDRDYLQFVPAEFSDQFARIEALEQEVSRGGTRGGGSESYDKRVKRLKGILLWRSMSEFDSNRQNARDKIASLDEQINLYKENLSRFQENTRKGPEQYGGYLSRIQELRSKTATVDRSLQQFIDEEDKVLTAMAVELLEQHLHKMTQHKLESQMALVNLYDDMAVAQYSKTQTSKRNPAAPAADGRSSNSKEAL